MSRNPIFNSSLIRCYDKAGPRYTSYPTAAQFQEGFKEEDYRRNATDNPGTRIPAPLSLYVHIPFCNTVCFYCACNKIVTKNRARANNYLEHLQREIALQGELFPKNRIVEQLHWGGGTPTFLSHAQIKKLMQLLRTAFSLRNDDQGDYSIEIDPRTVTPETISLLRETGFNRISLGVQDFDPKVQQAINRIQSLEQTEQIVHAARRQGFRSLNIDLIYGLPLQTKTSFSRTLDKIIAIAPERLSVFNYAHLPQLFKTQRQINPADLPTADEKLAILQLAIEKLTAAGYLYIGMDHFAKPYDELVKAQQNGSLHRNFQGYSTHSDCDLIGIGVSAISQIGNTYSQNEKDIEAYYRNCAAGKLPTCKGITLTSDDLIRRDIIMQLICHFELDMHKIEQRHGIEFAHYFNTELKELSHMQSNGLLHLNAWHILVKPAGRLLIRNICMVFDAYLRQTQTQPRFSKVI